MGGGAGRRMHTVQVEYTTFLNCNLTLLWRRRTLSVNDSKSGGGREVIDSHAMVENGIVGVH